MFLSQHDHAVQALVPDRKLPTLTQTRDFLVLKERSYTAGQQVSDEVPAASFISSRNAVEGICQDVFINSLGFGDRQLQSIEQTRHRLVVEKIEFWHPWQDRRVERAGYKNLVALKTKELRVFHKFSRAAGPK